MTEITHQDYMKLVERIEKLENDLRWIAGDILVKESQGMGLYKEYTGVSHSATTFPNNVQRTIGAVMDDPNDPELQKSIRSLLETLEKRKKGEVKCFFETLSPEDRNKPMGISCPCRKCSAYSLGGR